MLYQVTEEHDEAICTTCWIHTENFHIFYESIKNAQHCYSSDDENEDDVKIINDDGVITNQTAIVTTTTVASSNNTNPTIVDIQCGDQTITQTYTSNGEEHTFDASNTKYIDEDGNEISMEMMMLVQQQQPQSIIVSNVDEIMTTELPDTSPNQTTIISSPAMYTTCEPTISISSSIGDDDQQYDDNVTFIQPSSSKSKHFFSFFILY